MEWIDGFHITDMPKIKEHKMSIKDIDHKLFNMFSEQIFNTGFIHADPHPGNSRNKYLYIILIFKKFKYFSFCKTTTGWQWQSPIGLIGSWPL